MVEITINVQKSSLNVRLQIWIAHEQFVHLKITFQREEFRRNFVHGRQGRL